MPMTIAGPEAMNNRYRRCPTGKRDALDTAAAQAARAGMTYGEFMARKHDGLLPADALAPLAELVKIKEPARDPQPDDRPLWGPVRRKMQRRAQNPIGTRPCELCGAMFTAYRQSARYCSKRCQKNARNRRRAEERREANA